MYLTFNPRYKKAKNIILFFKPLLKVKQSVQPLEKKSECEEK